MENKVELLTKKDAGQFRNLVDHAFAGQKPFHKNWPHTSLGKIDRGNKHLGIRDKGKVISHVGFYPQQIKLPGALLNSVGIGAVATYKKYRGHGFMQLQLAYAEKLMNEGDYDISWLAGDRKRYGYFGWENGGRLLKYAVTDRTAKGIDTTGYTYKKYTGSKKELKEIVKLHEKDGVGLKRNLLDYTLYLGRRNRTTTIAYKGKKALAYICVLKVDWGKDCGSVQEYGGDVKALKALFCYIMKSNKFREIEVAAPAFYTKYRELFASISSFGVLRNFGMIKIINLNSMLQKFCGQMSKKLENIKVKKTLVTFEIPELGQKATLEIGRKVRVVEKEGKLKIVLNRKDMVRFLFGFSKLSDDYKLDKKYAVLDLILPLDIYMWNLETV